MQRICRLSRFRLTDVLMYNVRPTHRRLFSDKSSPSDVESPATESSVDIIEKVNASRILNAIPSLIREKKYNQVWENFFQLPEALKNINLYRIVLEVCARVADSKKEYGDRVIKILSMMKSREDFELFAEDYYMALSATTEYPNLQQTVYKWYQEDGFQDDPTVLSLLIQGSFSNQNLDRALELILQAQEKRMQLDIEAYNMVLALSIILRRYDCASQVFQAILDSRLQLDAHTFALIMNQAAELRNWNGLLESFEMMKTMSIKPSKEVLKHVFLAHIALKSDLSVIYDLLQDLKSFKINPTMSLWKYMCLFAGPGNSAKLVNILKESDFPVNVHFYNVMIRVLCSNQVDRVDQAIDLFKESVRNGHNLSYQTCETLLISCTSLEDSAQLVDDVFSEMDKSGHQLKDFLHRLRKAHERLTKYEQARSQNQHLEKGALRSIIRIHSEFNFTKRCVSLLEYHIATEGERIPEYIICQIMLSFARDGCQEGLSKVVQALLDKSVPIPEETIVSSFEILDFPSANNLFQEFRSRKIVPLSGYKSILMRYIENDSPEMVREILDEMDRTEIWPKSTANTKKKEEEILDEEEQIQTEV